METPIKKVRLYIATDDTKVIERFYFTCVKEHKDNLVNAVSLFVTRTPSIIGTLSYLSRLPSTPYLAWVTRLPEQEKVQAYYGKHDELLTELKDPLFRSAFEAAYSLYLNYGGLFLTTLQHPKEASLLTTKLAARTELAKADLVAMERHAASYLRTLSLPIALLTWYRLSTSPTK